MLIRGARFLNKERDYMKKNAELHRGHFSRIRKKIIETAPEYVDDVLMLEVLLQGVFFRADVNELARVLLHKYGSIHDLVQYATEKDLVKVEGFSDTTAAKLCAILKVLSIYRARQGAEIIKTKYLGYYEIISIAKNYFYGYTTERAVAFFLNSNCEIFKHQLLSEGTADAVLMNPDLITDLAIRYKACFVALMHNHPNGNILPSNEDVVLTQRIMKKLRYWDIKLLDHVIFGVDDNYFSFQNAKIIDALEERIENEEKSLLSLDDLYSNDWMHKLKQEKFTDSLNDN